MKEKIRVLHLLQSSHFSGAENVACTIIDNFKEDSMFEMAYCSKKGSIENILEEKKIRYYPMTNISIKEIKKVLDKFNPHIIHAHDATASVLSSLFSYRCKIVSHLHSNPPWMKKMSSNSIIYGLSSLKIRKILTVSDSIESEYIYSKYIRQKIKMIGNPIDVKMIEAKSKSEEMMIDNFDLMYLGRFENAKQPLRFINIVSKLKKNNPNILAIMVGDGSLKQKCMDEIDKLGLNKHIIVKGFIRNPYPILKQSRVLCIPSKWEGYGLVAVEALSLGVPVVCSNVGGLPEIIDENCGMICKTDKEFIQEINNLINNDEYRNMKVKNALNKASNIDNILLYMDKLKETYYEIY